jgi:hypothetical protein
VYDFVKQARAYTRGMAIDDPLEKIRALAKSEGFDGIGTALQVGGLASPIFKVFSIAKGISDSFKSGEKVIVAFLALCDELQRMQDNLPKDVESVLEQPWFKRAATALMMEAAAAVGEEDARLLGKVAAHGCFPKESDRHRQEDLASYIRDLARLGTDDIQLLKLLRDVNRDVIKHAPNLNRPDDFTSNLEEFKRQAGQLGIDPDDGIALGARLSGFGLAYEAPRVGTRQSPSDYCFRPTKRGLYLLSLLEAAEKPPDEQN